MPEEYQKQNKPNSNSKSKNLGAKKITVAQFCDVYGGISSIDRAGIVKKYKSEEKTYNQWETELKKATVIKK